MSITRSLCVKSNFNEKHENNDLPAAEHVYVGALLRASHVGRQSCTAVKFSACETYENVPIVRSSCVKSSFNLKMENA